MVRSTNNSSTPVLPPLSSNRREVKQSTSDVNGKSSGSAFGDPDCLSSEGKTIFKMLSEKLDSIVSELRQRDEKIERLVRENEELRDRLVKIERQQDDREAQYRCNNVVFSGGSLSSVTADIPTQGIIELLRDKVQYDLSPDNILSAYRLGARSSTQSEDSRRIMVRLRDGVKGDILAACKRVKPNGLYANDDLTPSRAKVLFLLRQAKKKSNGRILACGSIGGRVYAYVAPPNPSSRNQKVFLNDIQKFESFCVRELGISMRDLVSATISS